MKKILSYFIIGALAVSATACKKSLDINDNPNSPTSTTPELVLPQAIVGSAALANSYSQSLGYPGGFFANVYGFGGYGATVTLNYGTSDFAGLFQTGFDNANDYQYIIDNSGTADKVYSNSVARIMKAFVFEKLVDNFGDVPYTDAFKGSAMLTPKYDSAPAVYQALVGELNAAMAAINTGLAQPAASAPTKIIASRDPLFGADMTRWIRFANTLKLKMLIKMRGAAATQAFATAELASFDNTVGIIQADALVNPGYIKQAGRLAPVYNSLAASETNVRRVTSVLPTRYALAFFNGTKLNDTARARVDYRGGTSVQSNQLGQENLASSVIPPSGSTAFYTGADFDNPGLGRVKGPSQGQPIMLLAEARFLRAEAYLRGYLSGNARTEFEAGILASFTYDFKNQTNAVDVTKAFQLQPIATGLPGAGQTKFWYDYSTNNRAAAGAATSWGYLVNWDMTDVILPNDINKDPFARKLEAIITQKWIALISVAHDEAFAEYRRTNYPYSSTSTANPALSMRSLQSRSTSADGLIVRLPYPQSEYNVNGANVPQNVDIFQQKIFWDAN